MPRFISCDNSVQNSLSAQRQKKSRGKINTCHLGSSVNICGTHRVQTFPILQLFHQDTMMMLRYIRNQNAMIIQSNPLIFKQCFFKLLDWKLHSNAVAYNVYINLVIWNWLSPLLVINLITTGWKLPTAFSNICYVHARLAIHFNRLAMNINRCNTFLIQKPNNSADFAIGGDVQQKLHSQWLPHWASGEVRTYWARGEGTTTRTYWTRGEGTTTTQQLFNRHRNSFAMPSVSRRPYFWEYTHTIKKWHCAVS